MHRLLRPEFRLDPEIEQTFRRRRAQQTTPAQTGPESSESSAGMHEISALTALTVQMDALIKMVKDLSLGQQASNAAASVATEGVSQMQALQTEAVSCVYCGGDHLFSECFANPASVNYERDNINFSYGNQQQGGWQQQNQHPNLRYSNFSNVLNPPVLQQQQLRPQQNFVPLQNCMPQQAQAQQPSLEAILKAFMIETKAGMRNLETQVGQLANAINSRPTRTLPAATEEPKDSDPVGTTEQFKAIQLRSGKKVEGAETVVKELEKNKSAEQPAEEKESAEPDAAATTPAPSAPEFVQERPPPPFPQRLNQLHQCWMQQFETLEHEDGELKSNISSIIKAPKLELKVLPEHLKYAYLGKDATLPVIISSKLTDMQEQQLANTLKNHTKAMGWQISNIHDISPSLGMHRILLQHDARSRKRNQKKEKRRKKRKKKKKTQREKFRFCLLHPRNYQGKRAQETEKVKGLQHLYNKACCSAAA